MERRRRRKEKGEEREGSKGEGGRGKGRKQKDDKEERERISDSRYVDPDRNKAAPGVRVNTPALACARHSP